jgi:hypothetical protein
MLPVEGATPKNCDGPAGVLRPDYRAEKHADSENHNENLFTNIKCSFLDCLNYL